MSEISTGLVRQRRGHRHAGHEPDPFGPQKDLQVGHGLVQHDGDARNIKVDIESDDGFNVHEIGFQEKIQNNCFNFQD